MLELFSLIKNLQAEESLEIKRCLKEKGSDNLLLGKLFSFICVSNNKEITDKELSIVLYKRQKKAAIASLKSRLFHFILEVLVSNKLISKNEFYDNNDRKMLRVRKKMLQFRALYRKKNKPDMIVLFHLLNEIISEAKETEQYDVLIDALSFKKIFLKLRKGFSEVKKIESELQQYQYAYTALHKANDYYIDLITNQDQVKEKGEQSIIQNLGSAISEIKQFLKIVKSPTILYFHHLLQLEMYIKTNKLSKAHKLCLDIKKLLEKNSVLYRAERMGFVYDNICEINVYQRNFSAAIKSAKEARKYYSPNSLSYLLSEQQEFLSTFHNQNYVRADELIEEMLAFPLLNKGEFRHDKYLFFKACILFKMHKFKEAFVICNLAMKLTKDKGRWGMGILYLRLMCMIERKDDKAYDAIDALRKTVGRMSAQRLISKRDELIYKLFNEYSRKAFHSKPNLKLMKALSEIDLPENTWSFYSHELIPIDTWLKERIKVS